VTKPKNGQRFEYSWMSITEVLYFKYPIGIPQTPHFIKKAERRKKSRCCSLTSLILFDKDNIRKKLILPYFHPKESKEQMYVATLNQMFQIRRLMSSVYFVFHMKR
jgi:hypothetical protein